MTTFMYGIVVVSSARHAEDVGLVLLERGEVLLDRVVDAEVDDLEAGALEHHRRRGSCRCRGCRPSRCRSRSCRSAATPVSASSGRRIAMPAFIAFAASSTSGTNRMPSRKSMPDDPHALDEGLVQHAVGAPAAAEQDVGALRDLVGAARRRGRRASASTSSSSGSVGEIELFVLGHVLSPSVVRPWDPTAARRATVAAIRSSK